MAGRRAATQGEATMAAVKPPIIDTAITGWVDGFRAIGAMPVLFGIVLAIVLATSLISLWVMPDPAAMANTWTLQVISIVSTIVQAFLMAPLAIAVHRYVLLGEVAGGYAIDLSSPRSSYSTRYRKAKASKGLTGSFGDRSWPRKTII
jgi:hypothetical protein